MYCSCILLAADWQAFFSKHVGDLRIELPLIVLCHTFLCCFSETLSYCKDRLTSESMEPRLSSQILLCCKDKLTSDNMELMLSSQILLCCKDRPWACKWLCRRNTKANWSIQRWKQIQTTEIKLYGKKKHNKVLTINIQQTHRHWRTSLYRIRELRKSVNIECILLFINMASSNVFQQVSCCLIGCLCISSFTNKNWRK